MSGIFTNGLCLVVTVSGPGNVHLLSFQSNGGLQNVVGTVGTTSTGVTRFMLSHSYTFEEYAFYFDGTGEAVYGIGTDLARNPVGTSWTGASLATWGSPTITTADVSADVQSAVTRDNEITCFIIPDKI